jgi:RNA polymerase sigma-70 factor, ECF subfamily
VKANDFMRWWDRVHPDLLKILGRYTTSPNSAEDLEQDLAFIAWQQRTRFTDFDHFRWWALKRARGIALDQLRANRRAQKFFSQLAERREETTVGTPQEYLFALREIDDVLEQLPAQQRRVIRGLFEGKTDSTLAKELNVREATIRSLKRFGRDRLQSILEEREEGEKK